MFFGDHPARGILSFGVYRLTLFGSGFVISILGFVFGSLGRLDYAKMIGIHLGSVGRC